MGAIAAGTRRARRGLGPSSTPATMLQGTLGRLRRAGSSRLTQSGGVSASSSSDSSQGTGMDVGEPGVAATTEEEVSVTPAKNSDAETDSVSSQPSVLAQVRQKLMENRPAVLQGIEYVKGKHQALTKKLQQGMKAAAAGVAPLTPRHHGEGGQSQYSSEHSWAAPLVQMGFTPEQIEDAVWLLGGEPVFFDEVLRTLLAMSAGNDLADDTAAAAPPGGDVSEAAAQLPMPADSACAAAVPAAAPATEAGVPAPLRRRQELPTGFQSSPEVLLQQCGFTAAQLKEADRALGSDHASLDERLQLLLAIAASESGQSRTGTGGEATAGSEAEADGPASQATPPDVAGAAEEATCGAEAETVDDEDSDETIAAAVVAAAIAKAAAAFAVPPRQPPAVAEEPSPLAPVLKAAEAAAALEAAITASPMRGGA